MNVLEKAKTTVEQRAAEYGSQLDGHALTAKMWSAYLGVPIGAEQVAMMMLLNKVSRESMRHKHDNLVDIAGYARVVEMIREESKQRAEFAAEIKRLSDSDLRSAVALGTQFEAKLAAREMEQRFFEREDPAPKPAPTRVHNLTAMSDEELARFVEDALSGTILDWETAAKALAQRVRLVMQGEPLHPHNRPHHLVEGA